MGTRRNVPIKKPVIATLSVPTAGLLILAANPQRFYVEIINDSNTKIWIYFGSQNVAGQGIPIPANGFSYEIDRNNLWQGDIYAVHAIPASNKTVVVYEGW